MSNQSPPDGPQGHKPHRPYGHIGNADDRAAGKAKRHETARMLDFGCRISPVGGMITVDIRRGLEQTREEAKRKRNAQHRQGAISDDDDCE